MEDNISRKFAFSVVAILVIVLVTNNFVDLTGEVAKSTRIRTCIDKSGDSFSPGKAYYSDGTNVVTDKCNSKFPGILNEATCVTGQPHATPVQCLYGCAIGTSGDFCKRPPSKRR